MGNSASSSFITPTPRTLSWRSQKDDTVKLTHFLTQCEEDIWRVKGKQSLSVEKFHLTHNSHYVDLAGQDSTSFYPNEATIVNPAFVRDQGPWMTEFTVENYTRTQ